MNSLKRLSLDKKILLGVVIAWMLRLMAPKSIRVTLFGLDWHISEGPFYPLLSYLASNLIWGLFILYIISLSVLLFESLTLFLLNTDRVHFIRDKLAMLLRLLIDLSGVLATWLSIILGLYILLRGSSAIDQLVILHFNNGEQLSHPTVLFFIFFLLYSISGRFLKMDLLDLIIEHFEEDSADE